MFSFAPPRTVSRSDPSRTVAQIILDRSPISRGKSKADLKRKAVLVRQYKENGKPHPDQAAKEPLNYNKTDTEEDRWKRKLQQRGEGNMLIDHGVYDDGNRKWTLDEELLYVGSDGENQGDSENDDKSIGGLERNNKRIEDSEEENEPDYNSHKGSITKYRDENDDKSIGGRERNNKRNEDSEEENQEDYNVHKGSIAKYRDEPSYSEIEDPDDYEWDKFTQNTPSVIGTGVYGFPDNNIISRGQRSKDKRQTKPENEANHINSEKERHGLKETGNKGMSHRRNSMDDDNDEAIDSEKEKERHRLKEKGNKGMNHRRNSMDDDNDESLDPEKEKERHRLKEKGNKGMRHRRKSMDDDDNEPIDFEKDKEDGHRLEAKGNKVMTYRRKSRDDDDNESIDSENYRDHHSSKIRLIEDPDKDKISPNEDGWGDDHFNKIITNYPEMKDYDDERYKKQPEKKNPIIGVHGSVGRKNNIMVNKKSEKNKKRNKPYYPEYGKADDEEWDETIFGKKEPFHVEKKKNYTNSNFLQGNNERNNAMVEKTPIKAKSVLKQYIKGQGIKPGTDGNISELERERIRKECTDTKIKTAELRYLKAEQVRRRKVELDKEEKRRREGNLSEAIDDDGDKTKFSERMKKEKKMQEMQMKRQAQQERERELQMEEEEKRMQKQQRDAEMKKLEEERKQKMYGQKHRREEIIKKRNDELHHAQKPGWKAERKLTNKIEKNPQRRMPNSKKDLNYNRGSSKNTPSSVLTNEVQAESKPH